MQSRRFSADSRLGVRMPVITKRFLDALKPDGKLRIICDDELTGFAVQVTPAGKISFCVDYRVDGKRRRRVIGRYGPMSVDMGRKQALKHLGAATLGQDPLPQIQVAFTTLSELFEAWMARHVAVHLKPGSARIYRESFDAHGRARFGAFAPTALTFAQIASAHADLSATPSAANHLVRTLRAMLSWAEDSRLVIFRDGNPARGHRLYRETPKDRILSVPEIRAFIEVLPLAAMDAPTRAALMLELLLGQRSGEIAAMRKADVDLELATWTLPAADTKANRRHIVPLPPWSRSLIAERIAQTKGVWLFPSPVGSQTVAHAKPIESHALGVALRRAQRPAEDSGRPRPKTAVETWVLDFRDRAGRSDPITPHDLRRTCASYLELLGYGDVVRGAVLNHARSRNVTAKHYSAAELLKLKRTALLEWEAVLRKIAAGYDPFAKTIEDDRAEEARILGDTLAPPKSV